MLEVRDVRISHGGVEVIRGINLRVAAGEAVGIVGPNGAGKTTLLRTIVGLHRPSAGEIRFAGTRVERFKPEVISRQGIALVPEGRQIFGTLTVAENLRLAARTGSEESAAVLSRFPILRDRSEQRADRLSGGEQQQLAIARALLRAPKLLIVDEPSLGLAPQMIDVIYDLFGELRQEGLTMLLADQSAARTLAFCDRSLILSGGRFTAERSRTAPQAEPELMRAYLGNPGTSKPRRSRNG